MAQINNSCFVAGTAVLTSSGLVAIETVKAGDKVWATNPETGETALKEVVQIFRNEESELVHVTVNGEEIVCTNEHPFYVPVKGWTAACELRAGDRLQLVNGEYVVVEQVQHEILETPVTVYNFEVEDFHTYYVGDASILVHNLCESKVMSRKDAIKEGKNFLGDGFMKVKTGYYKSADGLRTMRFDVTHHGDSSIHINLETCKNPVSKGVRNKLLKNVHIFFE